MHHYSIKKKSETVSITVQSSVDLEELDILIVDSDCSVSFEENTPEIEKITEDMYSAEYTLPDYESFVLAKLNGVPVAMSVGGASGLFFFYTGEEGDSVSYDIVSQSGENVYSGVLNDIGIGFYCADVTKYNDMNIFVGGRYYPIRLPYAVPSMSSGVVKLQNNVWQMISIPVDGERVKEYFVDRLAEKYNSSPEDMVEICTAYFGDENKFRSYIPGVTNPDSSNNFPLVYSDGDTKEITGFWVKMKDVSSIVDDIDNITLDWEV